MSERTITIELGYLEHLLNCLTQQKFINDEKTPIGTDIDEVTYGNIRSEIQLEIDKAWNYGTKILKEEKKKELDEILKEKINNETLV